MIIVRSFVIYDLGIDNSGGKKSWRGVSLSDNHLFLRHVSGCNFELFDYDGFIFFEIGQGRR